MAAVIRVLLVDDNPDITEVLGHVVNAEPGMECVGRLNSADQLTEHARLCHPDVVLLDARMPGKDPVVAMRELAVECPQFRTIIHSGYDDPEFIEQAIDAGAWGFVLKTVDVAVVLGAIRTVAAGRIVFPRRNSPPASAEPKRGE